MQAETAGTAIRRLLRLQPTATDYQGEGEWWNETYVDFRYQLELGCAENFGPYVVLRETDHGQVLFQDYDFAEEGDRATIMQYIEELS